MTARKTLVILLLVFAVNYMDRQLLAILIEPIKQEIGMSDAAAGLLYGLTFAAFYSFVGIPIAWLADRTNRARIITISLLLFSAMTAMCGLATTYVQLVLARIGVGIGEAGTNPPSHSIIADLFAIEHRGTAMAVFALGPHVGIVAAFLGGGALGEAVGWRAAFWIAGALGLITTLITALLLKEPQRTGRCETTPRQAGTADALRAIWINPSMRHLFIGGTLTNIAVSALIAWLPSLFMRVYGMSMSATGAWLALVIGVFGGCGVVLGGWVADRAGARKPEWRLRTVAIGLAIGAPCWVLAITGGNALSFVAMLIAGGLISVHLGPSFAMVQTLSSPRARALSASLLLFTANLLGVGIGPLAVGLLSDAFLVEYGAMSLQAGLLIIPPLLLWAAVHYEVAARHLVGQLDAGSDQAEALAENSAAQPAAQFR